MRGIPGIVPGSESLELLAFCWQLQGVARATQRLLEHRLAPYGTSSDQVWALQLLRRRQPLSVATLAAAMGLERNSASQLVERLVRLDLVTRKRSASDRRQVLIALSPAGERLLAATDGVIAEAVIALLAGTPPTAIAGATRVLDAMQLRIAGREAEFERSEAASG